MTRKKAEQIAEEFISEMNPDNWDGTGVQPASLDLRIVTYDTGSSNNNELDISFELEQNPDTGIKEWTHYCELRDKDSGDLLEIMHGYGINSVPNLADTIMDICRSE